MPQSENQLPDEVSRSTIKREMEALQKIGETLVNLPQAHLDKIPVPEQLLEAVNLARSLKTRESIRRQLQYIGKIIRNVDIEPIQLALKKLQLMCSNEVGQFHEIENWRDRLIAEGDGGIQAYLESYPNADRQKLRQLVRKAQQDKKLERDTGGSIELFRYLKSNQ